MPNIAATYSRVSTDDQAGPDKTSLDTQEKACEALAERSGYVVPKEFRIRDDFTGATLNRPSLRRLRQFAAEKKVQAIVYYTANRLARDAVDLMVLLREFRRAGVAVLAVHNPPKDDELGRAMTFLEGTFAEVERREIKERTNRAKLAIAQQGERLPQGTGKGLYGYRYNKDTHKREIEPEQAAQVRRMFTAIAEKGYSLHGLATEFNREGQRTREGAPWHPLTIKRIITNPAYTGVTYFNRYKRVAEDGKPSRLVLRPETEWIAMNSVTPPIVSPTLFDAAQAALAGPRRRMVADPKPYLLTGHIFCVECGSRMSGTTLSGRYRYYQCLLARPRVGMKPRCKARMTRAEELEADVWTAISERLENPSIIIGEIRRRQVEGQLYREEDRQRIQRELASLDREEAKLLQAYRVSDMNVVLLAKGVKEIKQRRTVLQHQLQEIELARQDAAKADQLAKGVEEACRHIRGKLGNAPFGKKRLALEAISARVTAGPESATLRGLFPSYITIEQTSA
ncbi:MAG: hypothetical protein FJ312_10775 [SAR202 cluster bacterium]|nr:hypothetical protein [SAR202 cluster bacterium]